MRTQNTFLVFGLAIVGWMLLMHFGPTMTVEISSWERPGWFFIAFVLFMLWSGELMYKTTHRFYAPGMATTMHQPNPLDSLNLPIVSSDMPLRYDSKNNILCTIDKDNRLRPITDEEQAKVVSKDTQFLIYSLGGTHIGPIEGGGKDNGYFVAPADLVHMWEGEKSQVWANVEYHVYCENPDETRGERPAWMLPSPILERLKRVKKFNENTPVYFGYFRWQDDDSVKERHRHLELRVGDLEMEVKKLRAERDTLLDASSRSAKVNLQLQSAYGGVSTNNTQDDEGRDWKKKLKGGDQ